MRDSGATANVTAAELIQSVQQILEETLPGQKLSGLEVTSTSPISNSVTISAGKGSVGGQLYEVTESITIEIPFDNSTPVFYLNLYKDRVLVDKEEDYRKLKLAKIIIPKPGTTNQVINTKDNSWDAYIVNFTEYKLYGNAGHFEEDSIELLRDNIGDILADNLIGNLRLSENLKITNTQGTMKLDSNAMYLYDTAGHVMAKFNQKGTYFYNTSGVEIGKFATDGARIGNIVINPSSIQSGDFVSGNLGSGFQIKDSGDAEFNNIKARGKFTTSVFEKDTVSSVGGNLLVSDSDILATDMSSSDSSKLTISGDTTFAVGDILRIKDGVDDEWLKVTAINTAPIYTVARDMEYSYAITSDTKLCSHFDGADGATAYTDPIAGAYTFVGNAHLTTAQKVFGSASLFLDGDVDYVSIPHTDNHNLGLGDFTISLRVRYGSLDNAFGMLIDKWDVAPNMGWMLFHYTESNEFYFAYSVDGSTRINVTRAWTPTLLTWYNIKVTRRGAELRIFIDGVQLGATYNIGTASIYPSAAALRIGTWTEEGVDSFFCGWIDEVRIYKGTATGMELNPVWKKGTCVVNYGDGVNKKGLIYMTASDTNSPHIDVLTHTGSPWNDTTTRMRIGNVNGFLGALTDLYGIYIGEANQYLKYDPTNGLQIKGSITITGGNAAVTFYQATEPVTDMKTGDYWIDTDDGNALYTYQGGAWVVVSSSSSGMVGPTTYFQSTEPGSSGDVNIPKTGDYWVDTNDNKRLYVYENSYWQAISPSTIGTPTGSGLFLGSDYMGFYDVGTWKTFIDKYGNFLLGDAAGGNTGISWAQTTGLLTINGRMDLKGANTGIYGYDASDNNIFKLNCEGLCLIDPVCNCNYSDLSAGALQFHDKLGTVPYVKRLASGVSNTGCTIVLNGWTAEPQVVVSIKSLCSYASAQYAQNQKWDIFYDGMTQYNTSATCYGYCFDVHATLTLASGTGSEVVKNVDFGACATTEVCACISCIRFNFQYWCNNDAPSNYYYGVLCYRVCYKENGAGGWEGYCDYCYEQQHGSSSELKTTSNTYVVMNFPHMGCWDLMACCLSLNFIDSGICSSTSTPTTVSCYPTTGAACAMGTHYGDHNSGGGWGAWQYFPFTFTFNTSPGNVFCTYLCYKLDVHELQGGNYGYESGIDITAPGLSWSWRCVNNGYAYQRTCSSGAMEITGTSYCSSFMVCECLCEMLYTYAGVGDTVYNGTLYAGPNCIYDMVQYVCYCLIQGAAASSLYKNLCSLTNTYGCYCLLDPTGIVNWMAISYA
jgi:hypothetical protein